MGKQSQFRNGSVKTMKKKGARRKALQRIKRKADTSYGETLRQHEAARFHQTGLTLFIPKLQCQLCKLYTNHEDYEAVHGKNSYHKNKPHKGHHSDCPNRPANKKKPAKIVTHTNSTFGNGIKEMALVMTKKVAIPTANSLQTSHTTCPPIQIPSPSDFSLRAMAVDFRSEVERRWDVMVKEYKFPLAKTSRAPAVGALAADYLWKKFVWR